MFTDEHVEILQGFLQILLDEEEKHGLISDMKLTVSEEFKTLIDHINYTNDDSPTWWTSRLRLFLSSPMTIVNTPDTLIITGMFFNGMNVRIETEIKPESATNDSYRWN